MKSIKTHGISYLLLLCCLLCTLTVAQKKKDKRINTTVDAANVYLEQNYAPGTKYTAVTGTNPLIAKHKKSWKQCMWQYAIKGATAANYFNTADWIDSFTSPPIDLVSENWLPVFMEVCTFPKPSPTTTPAVVNMRIKFKNIQAATASTPVTPANSKEWKVEAQTINRNTQDCQILVFSDKNFFRKLGVISTATGGFINMVGWNTQGTRQDVGKGSNFLTADTMATNPDGKVWYFNPRKVRFMGFHGYHDNDKIFGIAPVTVEDRTSCVLTSTPPAPCPKDPVCPSAPTPTPAAPAPTPAPAPAPAPCPAIYDCATVIAASCAPCPALYACPVQQPCPAPVAPPPQHLFCDPMVEVCMDVDISMANNRAHGYLQMPYNDYIEFGIYNNHYNYAIQIIVVHGADMKPDVAVNLYDQTRGEYLGYWHRLNGDELVWVLHMLKKDVDISPQRKKIIKELEKRADGN